jgi:hypothetical protein
MENNNNLEINNNSENNSSEFCEILNYLDNRDLSILQKVLMIEDETEHRKFLRDMKSNKLDGSLYNAYTARVLVLEPIVYVNQEIILRFNNLHLREI